MKKDWTTSIEQLLQDLSPDNRLIIDELRPYFLQHSGIQETVKRNCLNYVFPNGMWCYINCRNKKYPILGVSRGAWMVRQRPELAGLFDEVRKVVGKIILKDTDTLQKKGIEALLTYISTLPSGIGVL